ncbi:MAG: hypothetical protein NPIRA06_20880 [Nitrospirales bacterium]|nr:MAG: hypothetical protein NPIRA06_20880 [Nitrospirales bacterium]
MATAEGSEPFAMTLPHAPGYTRGSKTNRGGFPERIPSGHGCSPTAKPYLDPKREPGSGSTDGRR